MPAIKFLLLLSSAAAILQPPSPAQESPPGIEVVWTEPGKGSADSMPLGNGDVGLNVWTEADGCIRFYVSKTDAWSGNARLLKLGRIRLKLTPDPFVESEPFSQVLRLDSADILITAGEGWKEVRVRVWVDANNPVVRVEIDAARPLEIEAALEVWRTQPRKLEGDECHSAYGLHVRPEGRDVIVEPDTVLSGQKDRVVWYHRNESSIWAETMELQSLEPLMGGMKDPLLHRTFGGCMKGPGLISKDDRTLVSSAPSKSFTVALHVVAAQTERPEEWIGLLEGRVSAAGDSATRENRRLHERWWHNFWNRSRIHAGGGDGAEVVSRGYALQRFINACGGRGASPIKFNGSVFTTDVPAKGYDADYRRWGGPYWFQNTRLPYWSMLAAGDFDLMHPLFRMYREALPLARERTRIYHGHGGAFFPETMYFWGTYANANYGWDREGKQIGLIDNNYIKREWQGGIELVAMMLDHFDYTGDLDFLTRDLLPMAEATVTFFDEHWERDAAGKIRFNPAQALETWWDCTDPMPEVAGLRYILSRLLALPTEEVNDRQRKDWSKMLADLPDIPVGAEGDTRFLLPAAEFANKRNQENPELYAVFPYGHYGVGRPNLETALETWRRRNHKGTGGWNQNPIQAACLGLTEEARRMVVENFSKHDPRFRFPAFWGPNYDWTPDQDHGGVSMIALQRMILQSDGDRILLLPAWPEDWDLDFKMHAPFGTIVEGRVEKGKLEHLKVTPEARRKDVVLMAGK